MKSLLRVSMLLAMGGGLAAFQAPQLPPPFHSESVNNGPTVIARPEGVQLKLHPGFKIEAAAEGFDVPRFMLRAPKALVAAEEVRPYCGKHEFSVREAGEVLILDFTSNDEEGE